MEKEEKEGPDWMTRDKILFGSAFLDSTYKWNHTVFVVGEIYLVKDSNQSLSEKGFRN